MFPSNSAPESVDRAASPALGGLAHGVSRLSAAELVRVAGAAALSVYLARRLGTSGFGMWTFGLAVVGYPLALVEAGLTWIGTRDVSAAPGSARSLARTVLRIRLTLALAGFAVVAGVAMLHDSTQLERAVVLLCGVSLFTSASTIDWVFYGLERPGVVAAANLTRIAAFGAATLALVRRPDQVWAVPLLQALGEAAASLQLWLALANVGKDERSGSPRTAVLLRQSIPLSAGQLMRAATMWSAVTILAFLSTSSAVGSFGAAQRLTLFAGGFATLYFYGYLPLAARAARHGHREVAALVRQSVRWTALATLPFALAVTLLARPLVETVFGHDYAEAAPALQVLVWTIPISVLAGHFRHTLIAAHLTQFDLFAVIIGAIVTVALNVALVPRFGLRGGSVAMVCGESALLIAATLLAARKVVRVLPVGPLLRATIPAGAMALGIIVLRQRAPALAALAGMLTYAAALLVLREVDIKDIGAVLRGRHVPPEV